MQNKGYTIPELIIVIVVLGFFSLIFINKASYAFVNPEEVNNQNEEMLLTKSATAYGEAMKDTLKQEKTKYISATDLKDAGYLVDDEAYKSMKIKIDYVEETDSISVKIIK